MKNDTREKITEFIFINKSFESLQKYDLVIVLGNDLYRENASVIQKLLNENKIDNETIIVISGNKGKLNADISKTEAELINEEINKLNLKVNCLIEPNATNIKENLMFSKKMVNSLNGFKRILLIGKSFASRRILMCADILDFPLDKVDIYGLESDICKENWFESKKTRDRVLAELERIGKYTIDNDLKI